MVSNILKFNKYLINSHNNSFILTNNSQDKKNDNNNVILQKSTNPILFRNKKFNNINEVISSKNSFDNKGKKTKVYIKKIPPYSNGIINLNNISNDINYVNNLIYKNEKIKYIDNITKENINLLNNNKKNPIKCINITSINNNYHNISLINNDIKFLKTEYNITPNSEYLKFQNNYFI